MADIARLQKKYHEDVIPKLVETFQYGNPMEVPRITKVVCNMGVGDAPENPRRLERAVKDMTIITGQKPIITRARKSISGFKIREGNAIGCKVTLRRRRMFEFLDRLISVAVPRIRDFRGLSPKAFDGRGNYSMGLSEQMIWPEIDPDDVEFQQGMNVSVVTTARSDKEAHELLSQLGFPFRKN